MLCTWTGHQAAATEVQNMVEPRRILPELSCGARDLQNQEQKEGVSELDSEATAASICPGSY